MDWRTRDVSPPRDKDSGENSRVSRALLYLGGRTSPARRIVSHPLGLGNEEERQSLFRCPDATLPLSVNRLQKGERHVSTVRSRETQRKRPADARQLRRHLDR